MPVAYALIGLVAAALFCLLVALARGDRQPEGTAALIRNALVFFKQRGYPIAEVQSDRLLIRSQTQKFWVFVHTSETKLRRTLVTDYGRAGGGKYILANYPIEFELEQLASELGISVIKPEDLDTMFAGPNAPVPTEPIKNHERAQD